MEFLRKSIKIPSRNHSVSSPPLSGLLLEDIRKKAETLEIHSEEEEEENSVGVLDYWLGDIEQAAKNVDTIPKSSNEEILNENNVQTKQTEVEIKEESSVSLIQESQENSSETQITQTSALNSTNINAHTESQSPEQISSESEASDSPLIPTEKPRTYEYLDPSLENETERYCSEDLSLTAVTTVTTIDGESTSDDAEDFRSSFDRDEQNKIQDDSRIDDSSASLDRENKEHKNTNSSYSEHEKAVYEDFSVQDNNNKNILTLDEIPSFGNSEDEYLEDVVEEELEHLIPSSGDEDSLPTSPSIEVDSPQRNELSTLLDTSGEDQGLLVNEPDHVHVFFRITYFDSKF